MSIQLSQIELVVKIFTELQQILSSESFTHMNMTEFFRQRGYAKRCLVPTLVKLHLLERQGTRRHTKYRLILQEKIQPIMARKIIEESQKMVSEINKGFNEKRKIESPKIEEFPVIVTKPNPILTKEEESAVNLLVKNGFTVTLEKHIHLIF